MEWKIILIVGIVLIVIVLAIVIYNFSIGKKDGHISDPIYAKIAYASKPAGNILKNLKTENQLAVCTVTRNYSGIRIEVASSGEPPIRYEKDIPGEERSQEEISSLLEYTAKDIAHFAGPEFSVTKESVDSFRVDYVRY